MITARFAGEQGRTLMAVPGRIDQASSGGCHQLIRDGAIMVTSVDDILEELRYQRMQFSATEPELDLDDAALAPPSLSAAEQAVLDCFVGGEMASPDSLAERLARPIAEISGVLMGLELKRLVGKRADGRFEAR
jgi:DNA processing protein